MLGEYSTNWATSPIEAYLNTIVFLTATSPVGIYPRHWIQPYDQALPAVTIIRLLFNRFFFSINMCTCESANGYNYYQEMNISWEICYYNLDTKEKLPLGFIWREWNHDTNANFVLTFPFSIALGNRITVSNHCRLFMFIFVTHLQHNTA